MRIRIMTTAEIIESFTDKKNFSHNDLQKGNVI